MRARELEHPTCICFDKNSNSFVTMPLTYKLSMKQSFPCLRQKVLVQNLFLWSLKFFTLPPPQLLNGPPRKKIVCKRGDVRQQNPLSPLLFVNTADLLQSLINDKWQRRLLSVPINENFGKKYRIIIYADDTLMINGREDCLAFQLMRILGRSTQLLYMLMSY
jgi:hypothetical protein